MENALSLMRYSLNRGGQRLPEQGREEKVRINKLKVTGGAVSKQRGMWLFVVVVVFHNFKP